MKTLIPASLALILGLVLGYALHRPTHIPDRGTLEILHVSDPGAAPVKLQIYRAVVDGHGEDVGEPPDGRDHWRVRVADGRVQYFACSSKE